MSACLCRRQRLAEVEDRIRRLQEWERGQKKGEPVPRPEEIAGYERPPSARLLLEKARGLRHSLQCHIRSTLVFPNPEGNPMTELPRGFTRAVELAGLKPKGLTFHSLRHTYASLLRKAGIDLPTIKELMGHADIKTTMVYAHLSPDNIIRAGAKVAIT